MEKNAVGKREGAYKGFDQSFDVSRERAPGQGTGPCYTVTLYCYDI